MSQSDESHRVGMAKPSSTSRNFGPGYRLAAKGRQKAEDDRLSLLEQIFDPLSRRRRRRLGLRKPAEIPFRRS